jgi:prepilin-type N-terminal cleavage/methylation domain-containing protein
MRKRHGFTILEATVTLVIIALLAVLLYPVFINVKRSVHIRTSLEKMRQFHIAIELYRNAYEGIDVFDSYKSFYKLGLPLSRRSYAELPGLSPKDWHSPCSPEPPDQALCISAMLPGACGYFRYVAGLYKPDLIDRFPFEGNGNRIEYLDYIPTYRQEIVLFVDPHCNPLGTNYTAPLTKKRGIALLLSGRLVNKFDVGNAARLQWYSNPPD